MCQYRELLDPIAKTLTATKIAAPEIGYTFGFDKGGAGKAELLHAILHTGNEGNKRKLLLGRGWASLNAIPAATGAATAWKARPWSAPSARASSCLPISKRAMPRRRSR